MLRPLLVVAISMLSVSPLLVASIEAVEPPEPGVGEQDPSSAAPCRPPLSTKDAVGQDLRCWRTIMNSTDFTEFAAYLRHFPTGAFRALAAFRLNGLLAEAESTPCRPGSSTTDILEQDVRCWRTIVNSTDPAEFEGYLRLFPRGAFRALAVSRLNALLAAAAANPRREQAGCFVCSANGAWRFEPTLIVPTGRFGKATDTTEEGEIEVFRKNQLSVQLAGVDLAMRKPRWLTLGWNTGLGIGEYDDYGLVAVSASLFVQIRNVYRFEYGFMYLRSAKPGLDSTQRDRTARFFGISFPGLSDKIKQLISR